MFLTELFRTATFRITLMALAAMAGVMVMQFGLVYAQLEAVESRRSTELLKGEAELLAQMSPEHLEYVIRRAPRMIYGSSSTVLGCLIPGMPLLQGICVHGPRA